MGTRSRVVDERIAGTVTQWKGRCGWIKTDVKIAHDEAHKHGGRIHVHLNDVLGRKELEIGAAVTFHAFADGDGIGAEEVRLEGKASLHSVSHGVCVGTTAIRHDVDDVGMACTFPGMVEALMPASVLTARRRIPGMAPAPPKPTRAARKIAAATRKALMASKGACGEEPESNATANSKRWWHCLEGDCCPISLTPLEELNCEPFGLYGTVDGETATGLWGPQAVALAARSVDSSGQQAVHWFDGIFLASFLVSSMRFMDPTNRRPLCPGECESLDEYLSSHGLPAVHVLPAYELSQAENCGPEERDRIKLLEREAAAMLRSLFDFQAERAASGDALQPPPPPPVPEPSSRSALGTSAAGASLDNSPSTPAGSAAEVVAPPVVQGAGQAHGARQGAVVGDLGEWPGLEAALGVPRASGPRRGIPRARGRALTQASASMPKAPPPPSVPPPSPPLGLATGLRSRDPQAARTGANAASSARRAV